MKTGGSHMIFRSKTSRPSKMKICVTVMVMHPSMPHSYTSCFENLTSARKLMVSQIYPHTRALMKTIRHQSKLW
jgi:uncharacterized alpha-E superfamily protein